MKTIHMLGMYVCISYYVSVCVLIFLHVVGVSLLSEVFQFVLNVSSYGKPLVAVSTTQ